MEVNTNKKYGVKTIQRTLTHKFNIDSNVAETFSETITHGNLSIKDMIELIMSLKPTTYTVKREGE